MSDDCRVYWGSHGCDLPRGHRGGHWCDCCDHPDMHRRDCKGQGCVGTAPYYGWTTMFYGEDKPRLRNALTYLPWRFQMWNHLRKSRRRWAREDTAKAQVKP